MTARSPENLSRRRLLEYWWTLPVAATFGVLGWMVNRAVNIQFRKVKPGEPRFLSGSSVRIAPLSAFGADYASVEFTYRLGETSVPCVALRLPRAGSGALEVGGRSYAAFSRVCTHLGCSVDVVRDPEILAQTFQYRPASFHPVLGCPCHFSVFDPLEAGLSAFGPALYPLPRVRLEVREGALYATALEPKPVRL